MKARFHFLLDSEDMRAQARMWAERRVHMVFHRSACSLGTISKIGFFLKKLKTSTPKDGRAGSRPDLVSARGRLRVRRARIVSGARGRLHARPCVEHPDRRSVECE
jgi:hypothetical protein